MPDQDNGRRLTTGFGKPVGDDQNSVTAGPRGPVLMQDVHLLEKLGHLTSLERAGAHPPESVRRPLQG